MFKTISITFSMIFSQLAIAQTEFSDPKYLGAEQFGTEAGIVTMGPFVVTRACSLDPMPNAILAIGKVSPKDSGSFKQVCLYSGLEDNAYCDKPESGKSPTFCIDSRVNVQYYWTEDFGDINTNANWQKLNYLGR